ncbi:hypothetical protein EVY62_13780 [Proteus mirabilis]|uniref:Phage protein n=2 Tax=Proteus mirabilis TaxID=584 RepID=B4ETG7_PROMH|nr:hypothetical protein HMPREF1310_02233 [Proteus mirabilis WGLW4]MBC6387727.1 hypothetical protein [Proteus mirabilis]CAR42097.1 putative phage protein [Proteus mirabilis HI4320]MBN7189457.1 hypothetical protein [Proteus mirabilis]MBN7243441.1 hypothetical protein [Proteus mirabilis]
MKTYFINIILSYMIISNCYANNNYIERCISDAIYTNEMCNCLYEEQLKDIKKEDLLYTKEYIRGSDEANKYMNSLFKAVQECKIKVSNVLVSKK